MKIEKYFILNKYFVSLFGKNDIKDLLDELKDKEEGIDTNGYSYFIDTLISLENLKISKDVLLEYDKNIQFYVSQINYKRKDISLKYFQYLAVLFTEIFLDNLKNRKIEFLKELNDFLQAYIKEEEIDGFKPFNEGDLTKIAFYMATGSGKTIIMHINYYQFLHYKLFEPDNIILITPNEGLSKQHSEELDKSNISNQVYGGNLNNLSQRDDEVLVIEITKFKEFKKGKGVTLSVDTFEGKNLIFVDEGHKGKKSEDQKWAKLRDKLAEKGFVFEYSATFGQILSEKNKNILEEYAKAIIFDYSYKYFYLDGYGKDFSVLNVQKIKIRETKFQEIMFVANLLSFYEQLLVFKENRPLITEYNIEKPLWIFVGATVSGKQEESDVVKILQFINKVTGESGWFIHLVNEILNGDSGLKDENGIDIFQKRFSYLRNRDINFDDIYNTIFNGVGSFRIVELKNSFGEFGLKVGDNKYFGVVNIGDGANFKKQLDKIELKIEMDVISNSLFDEIQNVDSSINILIGSRKFIEGWDTWRVSSMGLLNIGTGQGPQIIQLFGRGVRLKGKGMSLKRSDDNSLIRLLENLNIYGIRADYLNTFLDAIRKEDVEFETIEVPIRAQYMDKWQNLYALSKIGVKNFEDDDVLKLEIDDKLSFILDLRSKISMYSAQPKRENGVEIKEVQGTTKEVKLTIEMLELFDWDEIWKDIIEFKTQKCYWNVIFNNNILKDFLINGRYSIHIQPDLFAISRIEDINLLQEIAILVLKRYLDLFYRKYAKLAEVNNLQYEEIKTLPLPFISDNKQGYIVQIAKNKKGIIKDVKNIVNNLESLIHDDITSISLPRIYFDRSLYVPILLQTKKVDKISPQGLVDSEKRFILELKNYISTHEREEEIYLLRNFPISGIGFRLQWSGFYPDFIMWLKTEKEQTIVFIDPKGLEHSKSLNNEKIQFAGFSDEADDSNNIVTIKTIEAKLANRHIRLESFIISQTSYVDLIKGETIYPTKEEFIKHHVLFLEDKNWPEILFTALAK